MALSTPCTTPLPTPLMEDTGRKEHQAGTSAVTWRVAEAAVALGAGVGGHRRPCGRRASGCALCAFNWHSCRVCGHQAGVEWQNQAAGPVCPTWWPGACSPASEP